MEILIIGGGVIGLSIARELHRRGATRIRIVERGRAGREASWAAAGMLAPNAETEEFDEFFRLCSQSNAMYPCFVAELFDETGIDIEFDNNGTLFLLGANANSAEIEKRIEKQRGHGVRVDRVSASELRKIEPNLDAGVGEALFFHDDRQVDNRKLIEALLEYCKRCEIEIYENIEIRNLLRENGRIFGAESTKMRFSADQTILATGAWTNIVKIGGAELPFSVKPIRGQMFALRGAGRTLRHVIRSPKVYLVPRKDGRILVGATAEDAGFDNRVQPQALEELRKAALGIAPGLDNFEMVESWCGFRPFAPDSLPIIGPMQDKGLWAATAHYRNGILLAPITAELIAEAIISDNASGLIEKFAPGRFDLRAAIGE